MSTTKPSTSSKVPKGAGGLRADDAKGGQSASPTMAKVGGVAGWVDDRSGLAKPVRHFLNKVFPDHWSFMLGEIAMFSMFVALITGTFLTFWYVPSQGLVIYDGSYVPLRGIEMSEAYKSTLAISFDIRGGMVIRQIHHWSALLFVASVMVHMMRVFFTGAFRKPREINWVIGTVLSLLAILEGFSGYSLPDDLLSGTGLRAAEGFMQSIPLVGTYVSYALFGGAFPGEAIIPRFFTVHVLLLPAILVGLFITHLTLVIVHKHTQYPGPGRTNDNVVGYPMMPVYMAKAGGFFFIVFGVIALLAGLVSLNPVWMYGPYDPSPVTAGSQPDWYMGFADGALRLLPGFLEFELFGHPWSMNIFIGSILLLPVIYGLAGAYPFIEAWVTKDKSEHHLLDRPRNAPVRTGLGVMALTSYGVMFFAAGNDLIAIKLGLSINDITYALRLGFFVLPPLAFWVTKRICMSLQRRDRDLVLHGRETGRIVRTADGKFFEVHEALDERERWALVQHQLPRPLELARSVDGNGVRSPGAITDRWMVKVSNFYFSERVDPVTPAELAAAHHDGVVHEAIPSHEAHEDWVGKLHGGAEDRPVSDAYAPRTDSDPDAPARTH